MKKKNSITIMLVALIGITSINYQMSNKRISNSDITLNCLIKDAFARTPTEQEIKDYPYFLWGKCTSWFGLQGACTKKVIFDKCTSSRDIKCTKTGS